VPRKGIDNVIRSLAQLPPEVPVRVLVVGGDTREPDEARTPEIARLRAIARDSGVAHRVSFTGHRARGELSMYYAAADVFVTTPWYEPFGITPLEAMACGTPVVGSDVGGIRYSVRDGETGFLVPPRSVAPLAEALGHLVADPTLRARMGAAGLAYARDRFDEGKIIGRTLDLLEETARRRD